MSTIKIKWQADDGYAGGSTRPYHTEIDLYDLAEAFKYGDSSSVQDVIDDIVYEDFQQKLSPSISMDFEEVLIAVKEFLEENPDI